jgi:DNA topoisomerase III
MSASHPFINKVMVNSFKDLVRCVVVKQAHPFRKQRFFATCMSFLFQKLLKNMFFFFLSTIIYTHVVVPHTMITTSVRGHLASQDFPRNYGWSKCDPIALFDAPIETTYRDDMIPLEHMLRTLAATAQVVILWLDCDREGEAIGDEVRQVVLRAHNHNNNNLQVYRAKFSTVLHQEIHRALQSLGRLNEAFVQAVQARSELDLRVGAAFTRFQTLRLQLHFVVERWARIETFIPEDFWYLDLTLKVADDDADQQQPPAPDESSSSALTIHSRPGQSSGGSSSSSSRPINFTWKRGRLYDQLLTSVLYEMCLDDGQAVVTSMEGRPKNKWRPVPLATVELQKRASMYLRIGSEQLMSAAEELYQQGLITYPRTETERFRPEFQHQPLIQQLAGLAGGGGGGDYSSATAIGAYAAKLLTNQHFQNPRAGQHDDQAHPPITPCKAVDPMSISDDRQRKVYILVVKHYLACCSRDAIGRETTLTVRLGGAKAGVDGSSSEEFTAKGLMILERNWLEIYQPWERWSTGQGELPRVSVGSRIRPHSFLMKEGRTTAPQPISEVELISLMDRNGIGTDATIVSGAALLCSHENVYTSHTDSLTQLLLLTLDSSITKYDFYSYRPHTSPQYKIVNML